MLNIGQIVGDMLNIIIDIRRIELNVCFIFRAFNNYLGRISELKKKPVDQPQEIPQRSTLLNTGIFKALILFF